MHLVWIIIGVILTGILTFLFIGKISKFFFPTKFHTKIDALVGNSILFTGKAVLYLIAFSINLGIIVILFNVFSFIYDSFIGKN